MNVLTLTFRVVYESQSIHEEFRLVYNNPPSPCWFQVLSRIAISSTLIQYLAHDINIGAKATLCREKIHTKVNGSLLL